MDMTITIQ